MSDNSEEQPTKTISNKIIKKRSLFDFVKNVDGEKIIDLDDKDVIEFIGDMSLFMDLPIEDKLGYFYHFKDSSDYTENFMFNSELGKERYFGDKRICFKCNREGHVEQKCPMSNRNCCVLCGGIDHFKATCVQSVCNRCGKCGHRSMNCREMKLKGYLLRPCRKCPNYHVEFNCPLVWRSYKYKNLSESKINMSCSICFGKDHFSDDCNPKLNKISIFTKNFLKAKSPPFKMNPNKKNFN